MEEEAEEGGVEEGGGGGEEEEAEGVVTWWLADTSDMSSSLEMAKLFLNRSSPIWDGGFPFKACAAPFLSLSMMAPRSSMFPIFFSESSVK